MAFSAFSPLKSLISDFSHSYGLEVRMVESYLKRDWAKIVGLPLAAHTRPDSIKFRKLWISAENSVWVQQLMFLKPQLFEKIKALPQGSLISDMGFRVGEVPHSSKPVPTPKEEKEPPPEILSFAKEVTTSIQNPNLRACLTRTITKSLSST
jgi:hypothetical protein